MAAFAYSAPQIALAKYSKDLTGTLDYWQTPSKRQTGRQLSTVKLHTCRCRFHRSFFICRILIELQRHLLGYRATRSTDAPRHAAAHQEQTNYGRLLAGQNRMTLPFGQAVVRRPPASTAPLATRHHTASIPVSYLLGAMRSIFSAAYFVSILLFMDATWKQGTAVQCLGTVAMSIH